MCKLIGVNGLQRCPPDEYLSDLCLAAAGAAASKNGWQRMEASETGLRYNELESDCRACPVSSYVHQRLSRTQGQKCQNIGRRTTSRSSSLVFVNTR